MIKREDHFLIPPGVKERFVRSAGRVPVFFLWVDVALQRLYLVRNQMVFEEYIVSTSKYGVGNVEDSFKTPPGLHRIAEKYGDGAPPGRIFRDRIDTGEDWQEGSGEENLVLTRILRLEGLEEGLNRGAGIDSFERGPMNCQNQFIGVVPSYSNNEGNPPVDFLHRKLD